MRLRASPAAASAAALCPAPGVFSMPEAKAKEPDDEDASWNVGLPSRRGEPRLGAACGGPRGGG